MSLPLEVKNLTKDYGSFRAVDDVSFTVDKGEIFGLLGPNGAGKTTIISTITTLEDPTKGSVSAFGFDVQKNPRAAKLSTGVVPQEIVNHGFFSTREILTIHSGYYGIWNNSERIDYLLDRLSLWEHKDKKVKHLSGGMKRRLMIAKALVHEPKLLLLDEPTAGVDIELREGLWDFVRELQASGMSILLTTHYLEEAEELCGCVGILQQGVLRKIGETKALVKEFTQRNVDVYLNQDIDSVQSPYLTLQEGKHLHFQIPASVEVGELLSDIKLDIKMVKDLEIREGSLEEAFRTVLRGEQ